MLAAALARALEARAAAQAVEEALQVVAVKVGAAEDQRLLRPAPLMLPGLRRVRTARRRAAADAAIIACAKVGHARGPTPARCLPQC